MGAVLELFGVLSRGIVVGGSIDCVRFGKLATSHKPVELAEQWSKHLMYESIPSSLAQPLFLSLHLLFRHSSRPSLFVPWWVVCKAEAPVGSAYAIISCAIFVPHSQLWLVLIFALVLLSPTYLAHPISILHLPPRSSISIFDLYILFRAHGRRLFRR